jgi:phenylalanyl-tRNA synthetase beta subunit
VNFSFVSGRMWEKNAEFLGFEPRDALRLRNPISDDTTMMRPRQTRRHSLSTARGSAT